MITELRITRELVPELFSPGTVFWRESLQLPFATIEKGLPAAAVFVGATVDQRGDLVLRFSADSAEADTVARISVSFAPPEALREAILGRADSVTVHLSNSRAPAPTEPTL